MGKRERTAVLDDMELIKASCNGDGAAFRRLVEKYEGIVAATAIGMLGHNRLAEDVGQETFIRFYKALPRFRGDSTVATYLTRIAINLCLNEIKRNKRRDRFFLNTDDYENYDLADPGQRDANDDNSALIMQAIRDLPPKYRAVVVLRLLDGYSSQETADILELPLGTMLSRLSRAQQKLRNILSPDLNTAL